MGSGSSTWTVGTKNINMTFLCRCTACLRSGKVSYSVRLGKILHKFLLSLFSHDGLRLIYFENSHSIDTQPTEFPSA